MTSQIMKNLQPRRKNYGRVVAHCLSLNNMYIPSKLHKCQVARDEYIIRRLAGEIVRSMKAKLVQVEDIN